MTQVFLPSRVNQTWTIFTDPAAALKAVREEAAIDEVQSNPFIDKQSLKEHAHVS
jgi:hypothetical protein